MRRLLFAAIVLAVPVAALAQPSGHHHGMPQGPMSMDHMQMMHGGPHQFGVRGPSGVPTQPGQAAFAAIQEIVQILEADPHTDWSKVNIEALRQHLIDMNNVTLAAQVKSEPIDGGVRFIVTGTDAVVDSIRRMVSAHAATMDGFGDWHFTASEINGGAVLEVRVPAEEVGKLGALGFIGVMARGMHHQEHHLMIARGEHPHG